MRRSVCHLLLLSLLATVPGVACAQQSWPSRPVRVIVPVGAGSTVDIVARAFAEQLSSQLGQPMVVENRAGAGTTLGSGLVAKAQADGYTLLVTSSSHTITPAIYRNLAYDPRHDFAAVAPLGRSASVLVVAPGSGYRSVGELLAGARARPGTLNYSSVGVGTATHFSAERFRASAGLAAVHVPFKGGAEAMFEVIAGRIDFFFGPVALVLPQIRSGKLLALAVNSEARTAALPDVPTLREAGLSDADYPIWFALFAPAGTPHDIVDKLNRQVMLAMESDRLKERFAALGFEPMRMTPPQFDAFVQREFAADAALVAATGIQPE